MTHVCSRYVTRLGGITRALRIGIVSVIRRDHATRKRDFMHVVHVGGTCSRAGFRNKSRKLSRISDWGILRTAELQVWSIARPMICLALGNCAALAASLLGKTFGFNDVGLLIGWLSNCSIRVVCFMKERSHLRVGGVHDYVLICFLGRSFAAG